MSATTQTREWERDERGFPLGYYVTVRDAGRRGSCWALASSLRAAAGRIERELARRAG